MKVGDAKGREIVDHLHNFRSLNVPTFLEESPSEAIRTRGLVAREIIDCTMNFLLCERGIYI